MKNLIKHLSFIPRILILLVLIVLNCGMFISIGQLISHTVWEDDSEIRQSFLQESAAEEDYADIYETISLFHLYGEEYSDMRNVAEARRLQCLFTSASHAAQIAENDDFRKLCLEQAQKAQEELLQIPDTVSDKTAQAAIQRIKKQALSFSAGQ